MATQFPGEGSKGMVERIKRLLLSPAAEWAAIDAEPMTVKGIFMSWVVPLAAIGPVALLIGGMLFGYGFWHPPIAFFVTLAISTYVMSLVGTFVSALVIDNLAPSFGAQKNMVTATKVAAYSWTAAWVAGIVNIMPLLGILAIVGVYSLYLLWIGLPLLMKPAADKAVTYFVAVLVVCIVVMIAVNFVAKRITYSAIGNPIALAATGGTVSLPGGGSIDLGAAQAAADKMTAATARRTTRRFSTGGRIRASRSGNRSHSSPFRESLRNCAAAFLATVLLRKQEPGVPSDTPVALGSCFRRNTNIAPTSPTLRRNPNFASIPGTGRILGPYFPKNRSNQATVRLRTSATLAGPRMPWPSSG